MLGLMTFSIQEDVWNTMCIMFKSLFLPRVAEFIYIDEDNKKSIH